MKLATFNLYQFAKPSFYWYEKRDRNTYTTIDWNEKKTWIAAQLQDMGADVVGFQEVFSVDELKELCEANGYSEFATVDKPKIDDEDNEIFVGPVVAIASRFPIRSAEPVEIAPEVRQTLPIDPEFAFSRTPIKAVVATEELGDVLVYVAHLKSKRPVVDEVTYPSGMLWEKRVRDTMRRVSRGTIAALLQRGAESTLLYHSVVAEIEEQPEQPVVVLGDLNDDEESIALAALTMQGRIFEIGGVPQQDWPRGTLAKLFDYRLSDGFRLAPTTQAIARPFTHIFRGKGGVLDYVLVSNQLNQKNPDSLGLVADYRVLNEHLQRDGVGNHKQSDHGQVVISLVARVGSEEESAGETEQDKELDPNATELLEAITRQDFINLAGGVFQAEKHYQRWSGGDKWKNFWTFFFDTDRGWVKSVYGDIPIDELHQKQRHSIEHIVPRSFLQDYLNGKGAPRDVVNGATTNPLNFAASERGINSNRSNFPFDFEGDRVVRPFRFDLNPEVYAKTGLDAENEWVIPSMTRGDIARAILYMVLVYEIDELYNSHVETLVHWAKIDAATPWEIAYNEWVYGRLGIRNPLIDTPERSLEFLMNRTLLSSPVLSAD